MGLILNIDTATENAQVNLAKNGEPILSLNNNVQKGHASFLQVAIRQLVEQTGIALKHVDAIAVTAGPGSYTGLRVGMASAKGLCYALNKPLIALSTLEVLCTAALQHRLPDDVAHLFCPMIDARRMEVFTALYDKELRPIVDPCAMILDSGSFAVQLQEHPILFFGDGSVKWISMCKHQNASFTDILITTRSIASLSDTLFLQQHFTDLAYAEPTYLKGFIDLKKS